MIEYTNHEIQKEEKRKMQDDIKKLLEGFGLLNIKSYDISITTPKNQLIECICGLTKTEHEQNGVIDIHIEYENWKEI